MGVDLRTTKTYSFLTEQFDAAAKDDLFSGIAPATETPWLVVLRVTNLDTTLEVMVHGGLLLGRGITTDKVNLLDLSTYSGHRFGVSRQHAVLHIQQNTLMIRDLDSSNGTYLNSYRLAAGVDTPLKEGDTLELGKLPLRVTLAARAASA